MTSYPAKDILNVVKAFHAVVRDSKNPGDEVIPAMQYPKVVDMAHVCMLELDSRGAPLFDSDYITTTADRGAGFSDDLYRGVSTRDIVDSKCPHAKNDYAELSIINPGQCVLQTHHMTYRIRTCSDVSLPKVPKLNYTHVFQLDVKDFLGSIPAKAKIVTFYCWKDCYSNCVDYQLCDDGSKDVIADGIGCPILHNEDEYGGLRAMYPIDYLKAILKTIKEPTVTIGCATDSPMGMSWNCGQFKLNYLLAPRIESE